MQKNTSFFFAEQNSLSLFPFFVTMKLDIVDSSIRPKNSAMFSNSERESEREKERVIERESERVSE